MAKSTIVIDTEVIVNGVPQIIKAKYNVDQLADAIKRVRSETGNGPMKGMLVNSGALAAAVGGLNSAVDKLSADYLGFDESMRAVNTMAHKNGYEFDGLKGSITEMSKAVPLAREELANGLYQVISNGVPEDNWLTFLEASAKSAVGGMADLGGVVTVTSTLIKNYGLTWDNALAIQNRIQKTAENGVTSFEQLQQALPKVSANASSLGVSMNELLGVFATLTGVSGNTAEVSTQLGAVFTALVKPSTEAQKAAQKLGIEFDAAAIKAYGGFEGFLKELDKAVKSYSKKSGELPQAIYGKLFGSAESLKALIPLTGNLSEKYSENVKAMADSAGTIDSAFQDMASTGESQAQAWKNRLTGLSDALGSIAASAKPALEPLALLGQAQAGISGLASSLLIAGRSFLNTMGSVFKFVSAINLATIAMWKQKAAAAALATWQKIVKVATAAWIAVQTVLNLVLTANPIGLVIAGLAALATGIAWAYKHCETFRTACQNLWEKIKVLGKAIFNGLAKAFEWLSEKIGEAWDWLCKIIGLSGETVEVNMKVNQDKPEPLDFGKAGADYEMPTITPTVPEDKSSGKKIVANPKTAEQYETNIRLSKAKLTDDDTAEQQAIRERIKQWQAELDAINKRNLALERPIALDSLKDTAKELEYLQAMREQSPTEEIAQWDERIKKVEDLRDQLELNAKAPGPIDQIGTYKDLDDAVDYYAQKLKTLPAEQREACQEQINALEDLRKKWDDVLADVRKPKAIADANNLEDIEAAVSYYQSKLKKASSEEYADIQKTIKSYELKAAAIKRSDTVSEKQKKVQDIESLSSEERSVKIKSMGFDGINAEIREMQKLLDDTENPLSDSLRADVEECISAMKRWRKEAVRTFDTFKSGWSGIKGIGSGVESITEAVESNGNAWTRLKGIVDGFVSLYDSISGIVSIVKKITLANEEQAVSEGAKAVATSASAGATAAAAGEEVGATTVAVTANKVETASWKELAAAKYMAAHAYIPFAGFGIGAGFVASMEALVTATGIPMLAEGGIAYGPTLGLFGEYAGASSNPEVVAPLDKLKDLIRTEDSGFSGEVEFKIKASDLYGVLKKYNHKLSRS